MRSLCLSLVSVWILILLSGACITRDVSQVVPEPAREELTDIPVDLNRDLDILFVIDNSGSMEREHVSLALEFPRIIQALDLDGLGLPSLHVGVITTDLGAGSACASGDGGNLINTGQNCMGPSGAFIEDLANEDGSRTRNFSGTLEDTFSCIAQVGATGCGFEQPLEALRRALDNNPNNAGFLRDHAYLAVVIVTDEDDCSATDTGLFDLAPVDLSSPLGPPVSFRCFEFGVECEGDDPRAPGTKENCVPRADSPYLRDVDEYSSFLRGVKPFSQQVLLATISGALGPVRVDRVDDPRFEFQVAELAKSCETANGEAVPPIRLQTALANVGVPVKQASICQGDLTEAVSEIAEFFAVATNFCVNGNLSDSDPSTPELDLECSVTELAIDSSGAHHERVLPSCDNLLDPKTSSRLPCYTMLPAADCESTPTGLRLEVHYADGVTVPPLTRAVAACNAD